MQCPAVYQIILSRTEIMTMHMTACVCRTADENNHQMKDKSGHFFSHKMDGVFVIFIVLS